MRKTIIITAAAVAIAATAGYAGTSQGAASDGSRAAPKRIHLLEREAHVSYIDNGKPGPSAGDERLVSSVILTPAGRRVGQAAFVCTIAYFAGSTYSGGCHGGLVLPRGQVVGDFVFTQATDAAPSVKQAITGGTGAYRRAVGQFVSKQVKSGPTPFVIELDR
jgi:hypothetical protein